MRPAGISLFTNWNIYKHHLEMLQRNSVIYWERAEVDGKLKKLDENRKSFLNVIGIAADDNDWSRASWSWNKRLRI